MGGACGMTMVGLGYQITDPTEPDVTVVRYLDQFHICLRHRIEQNWKEILADTKDMLLAKLIAAELSKIHAAGYVTTRLAEERPTCKLLRRKRRKK
jgi:hypothetical protein